MITLKITKKKIIKIADSYGIIIPKDYITDGHISKDKLYDVDFKESKGVDAN